MGKWNLTFASSRKVKAAVKAALIEELGEDILEHVKVDLRDSKESRDGAGARGCVGRIRYDDREIEIDTDIRIGSLWLWRANKGGKQGRNQNIENRVGRETEKEAEERHRKQVKHLVRYLLTGGDERGIGVGDGNLTGEVRKPHFAMQLAVRLELQKLYEAFIEEFGPLELKKIHIFRGPVLTKDGNPVKGTPASVKGLRYGKEAPNSVLVEFSGLVAYADRRELGDTQTLKEAWKATAKGEGVPGSLKEAWCNSYFVQERMRVENLYDIMRDYQIEHIRVDENANIEVVPLVG